MRRLAIAALGLALGCETLIGAEFDDVRPRRTKSASCDAIVPPEPPNVQQTPGDLETIAVITTVDYGDAEIAPDEFGYGNIGYDQDQRCTNRGDPPECMPYAWTEGDPTDGPRGQDNAIGKILSQQKAVFGIAAITSEGETQQVQAGKRASVALLRVSGYTGFSEDAQVRVEWYATVAFEKGSPGGGAPKLDGTDAWPVAGFVDDADAGAAQPAVFVDDAAYVTGSVLVAHFTEAKVPLANVYFEVKDVVLTAVLEPDPAGGPRFLKNGMVAGISRMDDLLTVVPRITYNVLSFPLCKDNENYPGTKAYICAGADIPYEAPRKDGICDGATFALSFQTHRAAIGPTVPVAPPAPFCAPGAEPVGDTCALP